MNTFRPPRGQCLRSRRIRLGTAYAFIFLVLFTLIPNHRHSSLLVHAQSKGPGPRAGHCIVEHGNVLYFLGGTPPMSSSYATFTSLKLPFSTNVNPETLPWLDLPSPPVSIQINNLTMTFSRDTPTATPAWTDCFATDDGRIVVVGGSSQILVYNIASSTWGDTTTPGTTLKFGPNVPSNVFLNPVYIQSRILADGFTALVMCTLTWNSQPQPYYLNTNTWTITLAIGTPQTTPPGSSTSSSGWGPVPGNGVTTILPPPGFRHYTLAILGQDKDAEEDHYGNGRALILGGYSTLVTGQIQDWDAVTSFPVQQAPSNTIVMFGNSRTLSKPTRGSVAYAVSRTALSIFPGNSGGSGDTQQQRVEIYDADKNSVSTLSGIPNGDSGPRNTNFRGAVRIGQGDQVFLHGGVTTLDYSPSSPLDNFLDQSIHVWDGKAQQWGNTVNIFIPPKKTKTLMIGLIVGGVVLVLLFGGGSVYYIRKKKNRLRRFEEEDRLAKGAVLKNEDELHSERRSNRLNNGGNNSPDMKDNHGSGSGPGTVIATSASTDAGTDRNYELPQQRPAPEHFENYATTGRGASLELYNQNPYQIQAHAHTYAQYPYQELGVMNDGIVARPLTTPRPVHAPQEYPLVDTETAATTTSNFVPPTSRFQSVVTVAGQPVYGKTSTDNDVEQQQTVTVEGPEDTDVNGDLVHLHNLRASLDGFSVSSFSSSSTDLNNNNNRSNLFPSPRDSYLGSRVYSNTSSISFGSAFQPHQYGSSSQGQSPSYMPSPTYSATFSVPDSLPGSDTSTHVQQSHQQRPLMRSSELSFPGDRMEIAPLPGIDMYQHPATTVTTAAVPYPRLEPQGLLNMTLKGTSEAIPLLQPPSQPAPPAPFQTRPSP